MRDFGFSTGALAKGNYAAAVAEHVQRGLTAVEISALREDELASVTAGATEQLLSPFCYVSFHAPSRLTKLTERQLIHSLDRLPARVSLIVHPDIISDAAAWDALGERLCIENMDLRKETGRTVDELAAIFEKVPSAGFCLDLAHAQQIDPTMSLAAELLATFGSKLRQLHVSELTPAGAHVRVSFTSQHAFARVLPLLPAECPIIIESVVAPSEIDDELGAVREIFEAGILQMAS